MELNFDKEIDAILRKARESEFAFSPGNPQAVSGKSPSHLDADEISAFAENALPETAKQFYMAHLADCDVCRKKLSNLILLNAEVEGENIQAEKTKIIFPAIPWYRKLIVFPNLAYTLGALVLVFSGIIAFTIVQNVNHSSISEVSQSSERPNDTKEISAGGDVTQTEKIITNAANMANTNSASVSSSNSMTANTSVNRAARNSNMSKTAGEPVVSPNAAPQVEMRREDDLALSKDKSEMSPDNKIAGTVSEKKQEDKKETEKNAETVDAVRAAPAQPKPSELPVNGRSITSDASSAKARKNPVTNPETATVGGKIFNRRNNVWYDAAYNGQSTTNLTRGTNEYKKLDKNLRVVVENLGGTVVVVWKERAYRIQ